MSYNQIMENHRKALDQTRPSYDNRTDLPRGHCYNRKDLPRTEHMTYSQLPPITDEKMRHAIKNAKESFQRRKENPTLERMAIFGR